nr:hypothetical protein [Bacteroidota bacterium]
MIFGIKSERFVAANKNQLQLAIDINHQPTTPTQEPTTQQITYTRTVAKKKQHIKAVFLYRHTYRAKLFC